MFRSIGYSGAGWWDELRLEIGNQSPNTPGIVLLGVGEHRRDTACLGHAPDLRAGRAVAHEGPEFCLRVFVERGGADGCRSDGFQPGLLVRDGGHQDGDDDWRHHGEVRNLVLLRRAQEKWQVEAAHHVDAVAGFEGAEMRGRRGGGVEDGDGDDARYLQDVSVITLVILFA